MTIFTILYLSLVVFILYLLFTVGFPFLMALLIALLLEPVIQIVTKLFMGKRTLASFTVCSGFIFLVVEFTYLLGIKGVREGISLSKFAVNYIKEHYEEITAMTVSAQSFIRPITDELNLEINDFVKGGIDSLQSLILGVSETLIKMIQGVPTLLLDTVIFVIAFYLISMTLPSIKNKVLNLFDSSSRHKIEAVMNKLYKAVFGFIRAQLIISFFIFLMTLSGLLLLGIKFPFATAGIVTAVDILPIFGTGSVMVPLAIFYLVTGRVWTAVGLMVLYGILFAFRRIIEPKILGDAIGIGALSALASMYIAFKLMGVVGLFFGPATIILVNALISADILKIKIKV